MAFKSVPDSNAVVSSNFIDLNFNFNTSRAEAEALLNTGMSMDDIREYKRTLNGCGTSPVQ